MQELEIFRTKLNFFPIELQTNKINLVGIFLFSFLLSLAEVYSLQQ